METHLTWSLSSAQNINFREPVTLDFLDAELEDSNKEEVRDVQKRVEAVPGQGSSAFGLPSTCLSALLHLRLYLHSLTLAPVLDPPTDD